MREQTILTNPVCVFAYCTRPSRHGDQDHIVEPHNGGDSSSRNFAPLCRFHHRLKTHTGWTYVRTGPTTFIWTSPHGRVYEWDTRQPTPGDIPTDRPRRHRRRGHTHVHDGLLLRPGPRRSTRTDP